MLCKLYLIRLILIGNVESYKYSNKCCLALAYIIIMCI